MEGHVCGTGHCVNTLSEQYSQLAKLYGRLSMLDKSELELIADCHGATEVNLITALGFCGMASSTESLERPERAHGLVTTLSVEVFPGALQTEQKIAGWREALENEMNLRDSEAYHRLTGSKYLVGSSSAPYCNSKYPTHMYDLLTTIIRAVPKRSEGELQDIVGENFMRSSEGNVSEFQKKKARGVLPTKNPHP